MPVGARILCLANEPEGNALFKNCLLGRGLVPMSDDVSRQRAPPDE